MNLSKSKLSVGCTNFAFYMLFAGFFFYQSAIGLNLIPAFLGGFFSVVCITLFPFVLFSFVYLGRTKKNEYSVIDVLFLAIMVLSVFTSLFNFVLSRPQGFEMELFIWSISGVLFNLMCYMLAKNISLDSRRFIGLMVLTLLLMGAIVLLNIGKRGIFFLQLSNSNSDSVVSYQGFARSIFMIALYCIVLVKSTYLKIFLFAISIPILFFNGARTEFIIFIMVIVTLSMKKNKYSSLIGIGLLLLSTIIIVNIDNMTSIFPQSRMMRVFDVFSSSSGLSRLDMLSYAWATIQDNPLFGDYGSYVHFTGFGAGVGSYAHNIVSAWVNLGVIGMILYLVVMIISGYHLIRVFFLRQLRNEESSMLFVFVVAVLMALIFSKDYSYMLFGFMVGLISRFISSNNKKVFLHSRSSNVLVEI